MGVGRIYRAWIRLGCWRFRKTKGGGRGGGGWFVEYLVVGGCVDAL